MRRGVWLACGLAVMMIACATLHTSPAQAGKRLALVIGNNDYENVPKLQKAVNDAGAISQELAKHYMKIPPKTQSMQVQLTYADGTTSPVRSFTAPK
jgi:uncharacterized membrane protein YvbJ